MMNAWAEPEVQEDAFDSSSNCKLRACYIVHVSNGQSSPSGLSWSCKYGSATMFTTWLDKMSGSMQPTMLWMYERSFQSGLG